MVAPEQVAFEVSIAFSVAALRLAIYGVSWWVALRRRRVVKAPIS